MGSMAPYGYRPYKLPGVKGNSLRIEPEEAKVVQMIYDMYGKQGMGYNAIAYVLNDMHIPARKGEWSQTSIVNILTNEVYLGKIRWRREPVKKVVKDGFLDKTRILNDDYELYDGLHEPIITEEQWALVKAAQKKRNHASVNTDRQLQNPFAGILVCGKCGAIMKRTVPDKRRNPTPWFRCTTRGCDCKIIKCEVVENSIRDAMQEWLDEYTIQIEADQQPKVDPITTALEAVRGQLTQLQLQQENICEYLEKGVYTIDMFTKRNASLTKEINQLQSAEADLLRQQSESSQKIQETVQIIPTTQHILDNYALLTVPEKNRLWKLVMCKATVSRSEDDSISLHIYPNLPKLFLTNAPSCAIMGTNYVKEGAIFMSELQKNAKRPLSTGLLAHVDAGKTTLSEALLYVSGARRTLGRVDHKDAFLDTHNLERARGITIFSKQAMLETANREITLVDTPGHVDFSAEAERTLSILDCAVLVISGTDGVQAHTVTLWWLLERYHVPTFLFINKMDLPGMEREKLLAQLQEQLSPGCVDFGGEFEEIAEMCAMCDEALLENYLETGTVTQGNIRGLIAQRKLFPCCFGSGLKLEGVEALLEILDIYAPEKVYPAAFAARVYKISRDPQGNRLTWLKVTGGSLKVRSLMRYVNRKGEEKEEKLVQLRLYSADKFTAPEEIGAGCVAAVTGLSETYAGQALGAEEGGLAPVLEPVMTYRVNLPKGSDPAVVMPKLRLLEEEDPQLHLLMECGQIHVQIMGKVQLEIFRSLVQQRFGLDITLDDRRIFYKETIENTVEGVGHFEPLRHYAETHLLMEPLPRGSGLVFDTVCPTDVLDVNYQRLILTHLEEKIHRGVLTGSPITDMKITLLVGKAHLKHTEGGDFRQATYRAVRQGLMQAKSVLLEPWYDFDLTMPTEQIGRAITDIRAMGGEFDAPESAGAVSTLKGRVPAAEVKDYAETLAAYTQGRGRLQLSLNGYAPCHNTDAVVAELGYDPEADVENTPDSVFCAHGAGFNVKWHQVKEYMHLESGLKEEKTPQIISRNVRLDDKELEKIMEREFGPIRRPLYQTKASNRPATEEITIRAPKQKYIIVDGYNVIFAWEDLAQQARSDLDAARRQLCDALSSFAGFTKCRLVVVFDGYKQKGNPGEKSQFHNIQVVFTKEGETADAYIEALAHEIGSNYAVRVASSDALVQLSTFGSGVLRMSARELREEVETARKEMGKHFRK